MDLEILNIASKTDNNKDLKNHTHYSKLRNSLCGDEIKIKLIIKKNKILDFGYQENSCVYCQASASLLSKISINSNKNKINELCDVAKSFFDKDIDIKKKKLGIIKKIIQKRKFIPQRMYIITF